MKGAIQPNSNQMLQNILENQIEGYYITNENIDWRISKNDLAVGVSECDNAIQFGADIFNLVRHFENESEKE